MTGTVLREDYTFLKSVLKNQIGYDLGEGKEYLIESRLTPIAAFFELADVHALVDRIRLAGNVEIRDAVCEAMTTNETSFFRDLTPFELLKREVVPKVIEQRGATRTIKIWCAACSTGQEPYSISMTLLDYFPTLRDWRVSILATDVSEKALMIARNGVFTQFEAQRGVPITRLVTHFHQTGSQWRIADAVKQPVSFRKFNLLSNYQGLGGPFDLVFIRNVLIYFDNPTKTSIFTKLRRVVASDGFLFLGGSETVLGLTSLFRKAQTKKGSYYVPA